MILIHPTLLHVNLEKIYVFCFRSRYFAMADTSFTSSVTAYRRVKEALPQSSVYPVANTVVREICAMLVLSKGLLAA